MTVEAMADVIKRATEDGSFREQLARDPDGALHGYDVSYAERAALMSGDEMRLRELGLDADLSRRAAEFNQEGSEGS